jgi:anti-sigma B factor antagonist
MPFTEVPTTVINEAIEQACGDLASVPRAANTEFAREAPKSSEAGNAGLVTRRPTGEGDAAAGFFTVRQQTTHRRPVGIVEIEGAVTAASEAALTDAFVRASAATSRAIILSFFGLRDLNAGGVGMLMTLLVRANREGRRLLACGLTGPFHASFAAARLDEAISVYASEDDALIAAAAV